MLDPELASHVLRLARRRGGSFAEIFAEERHSTSIRLDDGRVEELTSGLDRGAGVRVGKGTSYGYAYSNRLDREALERAAEAACAAIPNDDRTQVLGLSPDVPGSTHEALVPASSVPASEKVEWLRELDEVARSSSEEVRQVVGVYVDSVQKITIATSDGRWTEEERPRVRMVAQPRSKSPSPITISVSICRLSESARSRPARAPGFPPSVSKPSARFSSNNPKSRNFAKNTKSPSRRFRDESLACCDSLFDRDGLQQRRSESRS